MANKEWVITKVVGAMLGIVTLISISIGAANVVVNLQDDVDSNRDDVNGLEVKVEKHFDKDDAKFERIDREIETVKEKNHLMEISLKEQAVLFSYIREELAALNVKFDNFEVSQ